MEFDHAGELVVEILRRYNVPYVFTLTGGHISPILIAADESNVQVIDVRDEATTVYAADAISRLTGVPGVAIVTAGPGVTNTITALKNAQMAESPVILIGGATATVLKGRGALQDIDQLALVKPIVKKCFRATQVKQIPDILNEAFQVAQSGVPGPVFIELPIDVLYPQETVKENYDIKENPRNLAEKLTNWYLKRKWARLFEGPLQIKDPRKLDKPMFSRKQLNKVLQLIRDAKQPAIVLGSQVTLDNTMVPKMSAALEALNVPTFLSGMSRGLLGKNHPLHMRFRRSKILKEADVVLLLGVPLDFRMNYGRSIPKQATLISVNRDPRQLTANRIFRPIDEKIHGCPGAFLVGLGDRVPKKQKSKKWFDKKWHERVNVHQEQRWKEIIELLDDTPKSYVNPLAAAKVINELIDGKSTLIGDGGDWVATISYLVQPVGPLRWLDPGVFGTLGTGAGFALASKLVRTDEEVWLFYGDGSAGYSIMEIDTMVRHKLPVIIVIGNDAAWAQIAREQVEIFQNPVATVLEYSDYHKIADIFGGYGVAVDSIDELEPALMKAKEVVKNGKPAIVNIKLAVSTFREGSISV